MTKSIPILLFWQLGAFWILASILQPFSLQKALANEPQGTLVFKESNLMDRVMNIEYLNDFIVIVGDNTINFLNGLKKRFPESRPVVDVFLGVEPSITKKGSNQSSKDGGGNFNWNLDHICLWAAVFFLYINLSLIIKVIYRESGKVYQRQKEILEALEKRSVDKIKA